MTIALVLFYSANASRCVLRVAPPQIEKLYEVRGSDSQISTAWCPLQDSPDSPSNVLKMAHKNKSVT